MRYEKQKERREAEQSAISQFATPREAVSENHNKRQALDCRFIYNDTMLGDSNDAEDSP